MDSPCNILEENPLLLERHEMEKPASKPQPEREEVDIRIPLDMENRGYWEKELLESMKPNWTQLFLTVHKEPMDILTRSRNGEYMVCASNDAIFLLKQNGKWWRFLGNKVECLDQTFLHPSLIKNIMLTDQKTPFYIMNPNDASSYNVLEINAQTLLVEIELACGEKTGVAHLSIPCGDDDESSVLPQLQWIPDNDAPLYKRVLEIHDRFRKHEISEFLMSRSIDNSDRGLCDFVAVHGDTPSVGTHVKTQGRAPHSIDKAPRAPRSATLREDEEVFCVGVAIIVLYTCNAAGAYEKWSINRVVNEVFKNTKAHPILSGSRSNNDLAVTNQLRRWLPFCKELAKKTKFFTTEESPIFIANPQNTDLRIKWMNKRAPPIFEFIKDWIRNGEQTIEILKEEEAKKMMARAEASNMKQWYSQNLKNISDLTTPSKTRHYTYHFRTAPLITDDPAFEEEDPTSATVDDAPTLAIIDQVRLQYITNISADVDGKKGGVKKRINRHFQTLAQNIVSHKRNYKSLVDTFEKAGAILLRMQTLEKSMHMNMRDLQTTLVNAVETQQDNNNLAEMKEMVLSHLAEVERDAKNDMKDSLRPVASFLLRKKTESELDDFIDHILHYVEVKSEAQAAEKMSEDDSE